jgi:hypothetical protein
VSTITNGFKDAIVLKGERLYSLVCSRKKKDALIRRRENILSNRYALRMGTSISTRLTIVSGSKFFFLEKHSWHVKDSYPTSSAV